MADCPGVTHQYVVGESITWMQIVAEAEIFLHCLTEERAKVLAARARDVHEKTNSLWHRPWPLWKKLTEDEALEYCRKKFPGLGIGLMITYERWLWTMETYKSDDFLKAKSIINARPDSTVSIDAEFFDQLTGPY